MAAARPLHGPHSGRRAVRRATRREGLQVVMPVLLATGIWGVVTGLAMVQAGLTVPQATVMSVVVYSATAQLAALPLLLAGVSLPVVWLTVLLANLRFAIYSVPVANAFGRYPLWQRILFGYLTTDAGLVMFLERFRREPRMPRRGRYFLATNLPLYASWHIGSLTGIALSSQLPPDQRWAFVALLAISGLIGPLMRSRPEWVCVAVAAVASVLMRGLPWKSGIFFSILLAVAAAMVTQRWGELRRRPDGRAGASA